MDNWNQTILGQQTAEAIGRAARKYARKTTQVVETWKYPADGDMDNMFPPETLQETIERHVADGEHLAHCIPCKNGDVVLIFEREV